MNLVDIKNIKSAFSQPRIMGPAPSLNNFNKPMISAQPTPAPTNYVPRLYEHTRPVSLVSPVEKSQPQANGFSLPNFSNSKVVKNESLYKSSFRNNARKAFEGTLKSYADRNTVANILWDRRGNGLDVGEVKTKLREAEQKGTLRSDQVRAVRRKLGAN